MSVIFATLADMLSRFKSAELIQLTDEAGEGVIDEGKVTQEIASASAMVEGFVAATYHLDPTQPFPQLLVDMTCDIARYRLYSQTPPELPTKRYDSAMTTLRGIRDGSVKLDLGVESIPARDGQILLQSGDREMSRRQMRDW